VITLLIKNAPVSSADFTFNRKLTYLEKNGTRENLNSLFLGRLGFFVTFFLIKFKMLTCFKFLMTNNYHDYCNIIVYLKKQSFTFFFLKIIKLN